MMILVLSAINNLISKSQECKATFEMLEGQKYIEELQISPFHEVYKLASDIIERHFGGMEMGDLEKMNYINSKENEFVL